MTHHFIQMAIFHGRKTPNEQLDDWGLDGPLIQHISSVIYSSGNLLLSFTSPNERLKAASLTSWESQEDKLLVDDGYDPTKVASDIYQHEYVVCKENGQQLIYYGDFSLKAFRENHKEMPMQLRLLKESTESGQYQEIILNKVVFVRSTYGTYHVYFETIDDCIKAQQLTDWGNGFDEGSLEMNVNRDMQIMVQPNIQNSSLEVLYDRFELRLMQ